jgi:hypothetical protein
MVERVVADVLLEVRGSTENARKVAKLVADRLVAAVTSAGLDGLVRRLAQLRQARPSLEESLETFLDRLKQKTARAEEWERVGLSEVAASASSPDAVVEVAQAVWLGSATDARWVTDRLSSVVGISWAKANENAARALVARMGAAGGGRAYRPGEVFARGDTIDHPRFGVGVVTSVEQGRIEVAFADGARKLAHGG